MTSPPASDGNPAPSASVACLEPGCERPVVQSAVRCRVHLAAALRSEGETIPFDDPELSGMFAAASHIVRTAIAGLPADQQDLHGPPAALDMYALLDPEADWQLAQVGLDLLGTYLADELGGMVLSPPLEFMSKMLLRLQVSVPAAVVEEFRPRLRFAMEAMIREAVGPDVSVPVVVELAEEPDESS